MQLELKRIQHEVGITFVHVTHDQEEAMTMADRIVIMNSGHIEQLGTPTELYESPAHGVRGRLPRRLEPPRGRGRRRGTPSSLTDGTIVRVPPRGSHRAPGTVQIGVRPEKLRHRRRRRELARRDGHRERLHRGLDAVHPRHAGRADDRLRPERPAGRTGRGRGATDAQLEPGKHLRRRRSGGRDHDRSHHPEDLLRRAAASGSLLTVPGLLAACGGGGGGGGTSAAEPRSSSRRRSTSPTGRSTSTGTTRSTRSRRSITFQKKSGIHVDYAEDINDNESYFDKIQARSRTGSRPAATSSC